MTGRSVIPKKQFRAPSITCPRCKMTTYNAHDIREGYCGNCHDWTRGERRELDTSRKTSLD